MDLNRCREEGIFMFDSFVSSPSIGDVKRGIGEE